MTKPKSHSKLGKLWEEKVRQDLTFKGFTVSRWMAIMDKGKVIPSKLKIAMTPTSRGFRPILLNAYTGTPDFIALGQNVEDRIIGVEAKSSTYQPKKGDPLKAYLTKEEKEMFSAYLNQGVFQEIWIAFPGPKVGRKQEVIYENFV